MFSLPAPGNPSVWHPAALFLKIYHLLYKLGNTATRKLLHFLISLMFPWPFEHQVCRRVVGRKSGLLFHSRWERNDPGLRRWIDKGTGNLGWCYVLETKMKWSHNDPKQWSSCKMTPGVRGSQVEMSNSRASRGDSKTLTSFPCYSPTLHRPNKQERMALSSTPGSLFVLFSLQAASQSNLSGKHLASVAQWATPGPVGGFFRSPHTFSVSLCVYFPLYLSIWTSFSLWLGCGLFKTGPSGRLRRQVWACVCLAGALLR